MIFERYVKNLAVLHKFIIVKCHETKKMWKNVRLTELKINKEIT